MSTNVVSPPFPRFDDLDGQPLENGMVWVGVANMDAPSNPIAVFWDSALTVPAAQPVRTVNGYLSRDGSPGVLFAGSDYSLKVTTSVGVPVYSMPARVDSVVTDVVISSGESLIVESGGTVDVEDGAVVNIGDGGGVGVLVNVASNARVVGNLIPNSTTQALGSSTRLWDVFADDLTVDNGVIPTAAGAGIAPLGTTGLPWGNVVSNQVQVDDLTAYRTAQPSGIGDYAGLAKLNARGTLLAACRQTSKVTPTLQPASSTADGPYNVASITSRVDGTMLVVYKVTFTVPLPPDVKIVVMPETDFSAPDVTTPILDSRSYTGTSALSFVEFSLCPINTAAGVQSPFTLLAYGSPSATGATGIVSPIA